MRRNSHEANGVRSAVFVHCQPPVLRFVADPPSSFRDCLSETVSFRAIVGMALTPGWSRYGGVFLPSPASPIRHLLPSHKNADWPFQHREWLTGLLCRRKPADSHPPGSPRGVPLSFSVWDLGCFWAPGLRRSSASFSVCSLSRDTPLWVGVERRVRRQTVGESAVSTVEDARSSPRERHLAHNEGGLIADHAAIAGIRGTILENNGLVSSGGKADPQRQWTL